MAQRALYEDPIGIGRISALSDGVFSIVLTLLVFDLKLPQGTPETALAQALARLGPQLLSYLITFFLIGIYWVGHHAVMRHVCRYDRRFLWLNLIFLMCLAFLPFPTSLLGSFPHEQRASMLYGMTLIAVGCSLFAIWSYATTDRLLVDSSLSDGVVRAGKWRILTAPIIAALSILISGFSVRASIWLYVVSGMLYILPARIDRIVADENSAGHTS